MGHNHNLQIKKCSEDGLNNDEISFIGLVPESRHSERESNDPRK
jgi:hypothetical protein